MHLSPAMTRPAGGYRHEAFLYRSESEFVADVLTFIRRGVADGEAVMVALAEPRLSVVRTALGEDGERAQFMDMAALGGNPARIVSAWLRFVERSCVGGRAARGVNELLWPGRRPAELAECHLHEALLNQAVPQNAPLWLRCPYDAAGLRPEVLHQAAATHPLVWEDGGSRASASYGGPGSAEAMFREALPQLLVPPVEMSFGTSRLSAVADLVAAHAVGAGVEQGLVDDLVLVVQELAASSLRHGPGPGTVRVWCEPGALVFEIVDRGYIDDPLVGWRMSGPQMSRARALWTANRSCDLVQVRSNRTGTAVRIHTWLPRARGVGTAARPVADAASAGTGRPGQQGGQRPRGYLRVLVSDLDGTLADGGPVSADVLHALDEARAQGVLVILVTGRRLSQLEEDHPGLRRHVDAAVLENGAVLIGPRGPRLLAAPVPAELVDTLTGHGVPHHVGEVVVDCDSRDAHRILDVLEETGLDHQMVRNRAALMLLPAGVTKATGLKRALAEFGLSGHNAVGVGDAENDQRLFECCEIAVAVANAAPVLRARADVVLAAPAGEGVTELLRGPLFEPDTTPSSRRWRLTLGQAGDGDPVQVPASPSLILVNGDSGSGKSFLTGLIVEQLADLEYASLVIDPEGDHSSLSGLPGIMTVGRDGYLPPPVVLLDLLMQGPGTLVLDLSQQRLGNVGPLRSDALAVGLRGYFAQLADAIQDSRRRAGRPHWLVVDEADSLFTPGGPLLPLASPGWGLCLTTYRPDRLSPQVHTSLKWTVRMDGEAPGAAALLHCDGTVPAIGFTVSSRRSPHVRHQRKYADGTALKDRPFEFRDDQGTVGITAVNVHEFVSALRRVPLDVFTHHMAGEDFARWIKDVLGDGALADVVRAVERSVAAGGDPAYSRDTVVALLERRYLHPGRPRTARR